MKNILSKLSYIGILISIISSCQSKEEKQTDNNDYSEKGGVFCTLENGLRLIRTVINTIIVVMLIGFLK